MNFGDEPRRVDEYSSDYYVRFLEYILTVYKNRYQTFSLRPLRSLR